MAISGDRSMSVGLGRRIARAPGTWVAALVLLGALGFAALAAFQTAHLRRIRLDGLTTNERTVGAADARWPGLAAGDEVIELAGSPLSDRTVAHRAEEVPVHGDHTLRARRGSSDITVPVTVVRVPALHAASAWVRFLVGLATVLLGAVGFALRPGTRIGWLFFLFCVAVEVNLLFPLAMASWPVVFPAFQALSFAVSTSLGLHTFCELPRRPALVERHPWLVGLVHLPALAALIAVLAQPSSDATALYASLWSFVGGIAILAILGVGARRARRQEDPRLVAQYRLLLAGVLFGLFVPVTFHVWRELTGHGEKWLVHLNAVPVIIYPAAVAYALLRRNVLGADRYTAVIVAYAATLALVGAAAAAVLIGVPLAVSGEVGASPLVLVLGTAAASLGAAPLYRRLKAAVDRRFQRHGASADQLSERLHEVVRVVATGDRDGALTGAFAALAPLGVERGGLFVLDPASGRLVLERWAGDGDPPPTIAADGALGRALRLDAPGGVAAFAATALPADAQEELWSHGLALAAAVPVRGVVGGVLAVAPRAAGTRFTSAEQSYLALLAGQVGILLERGGDTGPGLTVGRYRIERRLGVGGMAEVHLAWQIGPGGFERRIALKRPLPHVADDPELVAMFLDEARLAANLRHPNIAQVLEVGRDGATYFIAMEYVDGVSLRALLRAHGKKPLPLPHALAIADGLCAALECAHAATDARGQPLELVHRDVTPSNVLVSVDGEVKLVDFGVAHARARLHVTRAGVVKGTPAYMSPEQSAGRDVDRRSDLFSLAVILYELLAGRQPWPGGPPARPTQPRSIDGVPAALAAVLSGALSWDPAERFDAAPRLRAALLFNAAPVRPASAAELAAAVARARSTDAINVVVEEPTQLAAADPAAATAVTRPT